MKTIFTDSYHTVDTVELAKAYIICSLIGIGEENIKNI